MTTELRVDVVHGPNLQLLGRREPDVYGTTTLAQIDQALKSAAADLDVRLSTFQSNHEGELLDHLGSLEGATSGILINPAGLTHTSVALVDALSALAVPVVEVHLSNPQAREPFRHHSYVAGVALGTVSGFGWRSYLLGLQGLVEHLRS